MRELTVEEVDSVSGGAVFAAETGWMAGVAGTLGV